MYKQTKYKVLLVELVEGESKWVEKDVKEIILGDLEIEKVKTTDGAEIIIDNVSAFARESTNMFDKIGAELLSGDIVKFPFDVPAEGEEAKIDTMGAIYWINGAYCIPLEDKNAIVYLNQQNVMLMEKIGNVYQHAPVLEKPIDESVFEVKEENTADENGQASAEETITN